ncbi:hypothetical protein P170DRAFT_441664 [Aspergillus steynii IBT 23096]|uniref:SAP domain-containing protein n=1 Tax=Aspergillus steynii IBT 23096 TaxID=1392250 RepID=A0A2I2FRD7_9EURO|nr:uncharacterized protein P170DRAFT_441664 [Aspergillus steynii IBT 23096]PLB43204.1 hypothetical protein P170DRAFT_441664 [Aspergillus steynii IBT 23096]
MADYSKWKVTDLKAELKRRGIPQTGLRVKQNFIDKLLEEDAKGDSEAVSEEPATTQETPQEDVQPAAPEQEAPEPATDDAVESQDQKPEESPQEQEPQQREEPVQNGEAPVEEKAPEETPAADQTAEQSPQAPREQDENEASAQPVEQAPGSTEAQQPAAEEESQPSKATEEVASAVPQISEANTGLSTPLAPEEVLEDRRKRKRRSQSPIPTPEALAHKKAKAENEEPKVALPEDKDAMDVDGDAQQDQGVPEPQEAAESRADTEPEHKTSPAQDEAQEDKSNEPVPETTPTKKDGPAKQDVRFKGLFTAPEPEPRPASPAPEDAMEDETVEPAKHAATSALYVDGLMRPLQPNALKSHLLTLASPPGGSQDSDVITDFYLDSIKTHCFVSFVNVSAASRVRAALHNTVWPNERNRKTLFVDFIPENKLQEWVDLEEGSRRRGGPPPRWEVKYDRTDDGVKAVLEEIDPRSATSQPSRGREQAEFSRPPPLGPRAEMGEPSRRPSGHSEADSKPRPGQGFKPLDDLFMSTTTKPKLYYLPVPRSVADRRLDRFDDLLRKGSFPRRGGDEPRRITFEDEDLFVDHGPDFNPRGGRGGRGGRGRGRGRGGFGDSWRDDRRGRNY